MSDVVYDNVEIREVTERPVWLDWRKEDMTASVGACLFGDDIHPHTSAYQQWAFHSRLWTPPPISEKLARRAALVEKFAPDVVAEERPDWVIVPNPPYYYRYPAENIGATPDFRVFRPDIEGPGNLQIKSVGVRAFRKWKDRDTGEINLPLWIAIQCNIEAPLMGATWAAVAAITIGDHGLDCEIIEVPVRPEVFAAFRVHAAEFWRRVREKRPYPIDWGKDVDAVLDIYGDDDGSTVELTGNPMAVAIMRQRAPLKEVEAQGAWAEKHRRRLDAQLIALMGNARTARFEGVMIKAPTVIVPAAERKGYKFRRITISDEARDDTPADTDGAA